MPRRPRERLAMPSRQALARKPDLANEPPCELAEATREQTKALDRQTAKIDEMITTLQGAVSTFTPAAEAVAQLGSAQKKLCDFLVANRLKLTTGLIGLLLGAGAISPTLATALQTFLAGFGK